jgi:hypothetical protein
MSLNWQFTDEEVFEALPKTDEERNITNLLIWGTMSVGLSEITHKNIDKWLERCYMLEKVDRELAQSPDPENGGFKPWSPTRKNLEDRIGLSTNAERRTDAWFRKKMAEEVEIYAQDRLKREVKMAGGSSK